MTDSKINRLRQICLGFPEAAERETWDVPTFRVREKIFAMLSYDGGRPNVWCKAAPGAQDVLVGADPGRFFVPPYVGRHGWIGIRLDAADWGVVAALVEDSYRLTAPKRLVARLQSSYRKQHPVEKATSKGRQVRDRRLWLSRQYRGRKTLPSWIESFESACGVRVSPDDFLSLEETERLRAAFFRRKKQHDRDDRYWTRHQFSHLERMVRNVAGSAYDRTVVLFSNEDRYIGALRVMLGPVLTNLRESWGLVGQDLLLATEDLHHGLCLEVNFLAPDGFHDDKGFYQMTAWGDFEPEGL